MTPGKHSHTAQGAAMYRAAHQLVDVPPVFHDPLAVKIVGADAEHELRSGRSRHSTRQAAGLRAFVAARSRFSDECFDAAFVRGVRQYVVLGAGPDTFAYRSTFEELKIYEVDHASTQAWKRQRLQQVSIAIPGNVSYVALDFSQQSLSEGLAQAQFDFSRPAFFSWLGVTPYLSVGVTMNALNNVVRTAPSGTEIMFDFATPATADTQLTIAGRNALAARVDAAGEPFKKPILSRRLRTDLLSMGFCVLELTDGVALNQLYFTGRNDGLTLRGGHIVRARV